MPTFGPPEDRDADRLLARLGRPACREAGRRSRRAGRRFRGRAPTETGSGRRARAGGTRTPRPRAAGSSILFAIRKIGLREWRRIAASSSSPGVMPGPRVDDEEDEVGLGDRASRLLGDLLRQRRRVGDVHAAGVDEQEALAGPLAVELLAVARDAGVSWTTACARAGQPVDERRLADVREADDRDRAEQFLAAHGGVAKSGRPFSCRPPSQRQSRWISSWISARAFPVALARARDALETHRLAPGDGHRMEVAESSRTGSRRSRAGTTGTSSWRATIAAPGIASPGMPFFCRVPRRRGRAHLHHGRSRASLESLRGRTRPGARKRPERADQVPEAEVAVDLALREVVDRPRTGRPEGAAGRSTRSG